MCVCVGGGVGGPASTLDIDSEAPPMRRARTLPPLLLLFLLLLPHHRPPPPPHYSRAILTSFPFVYHPLLPCFLPLLFFSSHKKSLLRAEPTFVMVSSGQRHGNIKTHPHEAVDRYVPSGPGSRVPGPERGEARGGGE